MDLHVGWIYGNENDRLGLERLGVRGAMVWRLSNNRKSLTLPARKKSGVFEHCECTSEVLAILAANYPAFYRGSFSRFKDKADYKKYRERLNL